MVEYFLAWRILPGVKWQKATVVMAVLALWLAAANHCKLESIPGFQFLVCCEQGEAPHQDSDCDTDACALVESGLYKAENNRVTVSAPAGLAVFFLPPPLEQMSDLEALKRLCLDLVPPELPRVWQFSQRTALPPRAPSLRS